MDPVFSVANGKGESRNIFSSKGGYQKPLVLLGKSTQQGKELVRLAQSWQSNPFLSSSGRVPKIVLLQGSSPSVTIDATNVDIVDETSLVEDILNGQSPYTWPDIIVLDTMEDQQQSSPDLAMTTTTAQRLYQDGSLLSIYVNVEPTGDVARSSTEQATKQDEEETMFVPFSDYELCIRNEGTTTTTSTSSNKDELDWSHIEWELTRLVARARLQPAIPGDSSQSANTAHLTMGPHTFFLSLSFADITEVQPYAAEMCLDVDAMEYRTDLLACRDSRFDLIYGMQQLRSYCRPNTVRVPALPLAGGVLEDVMPIVYTVRTDGQAGTFPVTDQASEAQMFETLEWGLRGGVEVLDVESAWDATRTSHLLNLAESRYSSQVLGSHHVVKETVTTEDAVLLFQQCALNGRAHAAKVVLSIDTEDQDRMAYEAGLIATELARQDGQPIIPQIALILGTVGQFSRIINLPFTPVTHESLPLAAAPGQLSAVEIMTTRLLTKIFESKKYAILGHNIAYSVSPQSELSEPDF